MHWQLLKPPSQKTSRGNQTKVDQRTNIERELFLISQTRSPLNPIAASTKNRLMFDRLNSGRPFPSMKPTHEELKARLTGRGSLKRHVTSVSRLLKTLIENLLRGETNSRDERKGYRFHRLRKLFTAHARATGSASFLGRSLHALN